MAQIKYRETGTGRGTLTHIRGIDLTGIEGMFCSSLLGGFGAEVIRIAVPKQDGDAGYDQYYSKDERFPFKDLVRFFLNLNKKSITLDIEKVKGKEILKRLAHNVDFIIESYEPGHLDSLGLGYRALSQVNPKLILVSITPFGQSGPYAGYKGSDLICQAMSGAMYVTGDPDRAPVRIGGCQAYIMAGVHAAMATLLAIQARHIIGTGQHVDVSIRDSIAKASQHSTMFYEMQNIISKRIGARIKSGGGGVFAREFKYLFKSKDGYMAALYTGEWQERTIDWLDSKGMAGDLTANKWREKAYLKSKAVLTQEEQDYITRVVGEFIAKHTVNELYDGAHERHIGWAPVLTPKEIYQYVQLQATEFFTEVKHPRYGLIRIPGFPYKLNGCRPIVWRVPIPGDSNEDIYEGELGLSASELSALKADGTI